jgi:hypothetical protein
MYKNECTIIEHWLAPIKIHDTFSDIKRPIGSNGSSTGSSTGSNIESKLQLNYTD